MKYRIAATMIAPAAATMNGHQGIRPGWDASSRGGGWGMGNALTGNDGRDLPVERPPRPSSCNFWRRGVFSGKATPAPMRLLIALLLFALLLVLCWPLALLFLVAWPFLWLLSIPFRVVGALLEVMLAVVGAVLLFPFRVMGLRR